MSGLGVPLRLDVDDPDLAATLAVLTAELAIWAPAVGSVQVLGCPPGRIRSPGWSADAETVASALSGVLTAVNLTGVALTPHLALHCAVVARGSNAVVLAAASGTGKTTLTAELLQHGWDHVSDEALVLPWDGTPLVPYPRPLALSPWSAARLGVTGVPGADEVFLTVDDLGARVARGPLTIRHVVEVVREGHPAGLVPLHRAVALQALWRRGFTHHHDPARALRLLSDVVSGATCWRLDVAEPGAQAALLEQLA